MEKYKNREEYIEDLKKRATLPKGFKVAVAPLEFYPAEKDLNTPLPMTLSLVLLDRETESFAGVFTKNSFPGHPVIHGREVLNKSVVRGVLINNKISNVQCPGGGADIDKILLSLSKELEIGETPMFASSTGIIGWKLPVDKIVETIPLLKGNINSDSILPLAEGIMTTDNFPKIRSVDIGGGKIVAVAKGAGMIEPNMATMLVFILTDIEISRDSLRDIHSRVMNKTFNRISIDSDQSTSDTAISFSSNLVSGVSLTDFEEGLLGVCKDLSQDIVRNGEGTAHVIEVNVKGAITEETALLIGKAVINAPLVKTAIYGNDPNLGRIIQSIGDVTGSLNIDIEPENMRVYIGGECLYANGEFNLSNTLEEKLTIYLKDRSFNEKSIGFPEHRKNVEIMIDLQSGKEEVKVYGSDLSYEYVKENADYRS